MDCSRIAGLAFALLFACGERDDCSAPDGRCVDRATGHGGQSPAIPGTAGSGGSAPSDGGEAAVTESSFGGDSFGDAPSGAAGNAWRLGGTCMFDDCQCPPDLPDSCGSGVVCTDFSVDPDHCGGCEIQCPEASPCGSGVCAPEPVEINNRSGCSRADLVMEGDALYALYDVDDGRSITPVLGPGFSWGWSTAVLDAVAFAVDATGIYVVTGASLTRLTGTAEDTVVTEAGPIFDIAIDEGTLYYAVGTDIKSVSASALNGTGTVVATAADGGQPRSIAVGGGWLLWTADVSDNVEAVLPTFSQKTLGASVASLPLPHHNLAISPANAYWVDGSTILGSAYIEEGPTTHEMSRSSDGAPISALALDTGFNPDPNQGMLVFAANGRVEVARAQILDPWAPSFVGQDGTPLARHQGEIQSIAIGSDDLYWSSRRGDECWVMTLPIPY